ncbi:PAAR-like protein [Aquimarina latercula]|uniref:PAAR-like protein n=1 Tax=Aquimarina latercula TaxID=987 RepID=UPI000409D6A5|nr:PAAR-like protein [Aquimarina latercula]
MSAKYIPNKTPVVCTYQTSPAPSELIVTRSTVTVMYKSKKEPLLTIADKNIQVAFACKIPMNLAGSLFAFGAGLLLGAALILSGPIGWAVIAVGAAVMAAGAVTYVVAKVSHTCTPNLEAGAWSLQHSTVKLDQSPAVTQMSIMTCGKSGILKPILDPGLAQKAAEEIAFGNSVEVGANMAISFLFGFGLVSAGAAGWGAVSKMFLTTAIGTPLISLATTAEKDIIRSNSLEDNKSYENLNKVEGLSYVPEWISDTGTIDPSDPENIGDVLSFQNWEEARRILTERGVAKENLPIYERLYRMPRSQRRAALRSLKKTNPEIARAIEKHGRTSLTKDQVKIERASNSETVRTGNRLAAAKKIESFSVVALILPFVSTWFTESARKELAIAASMDLISGQGTISAQSPI